MTLDRKQMYYSPDLTDYNLMNAREKLQTEVAAGLFKADPDIPMYR